MRGRRATPPGASPSAGRDASFLATLPLPRLYPAPPLPLIVGARSGREERRWRGGSTTAGSRREEARRRDTPSSPSLPRPDPVGIRGGVTAPPALRHCCERIWLGGGTTPWDLARAWPDLAVRWWIRMSPHVHGIFQALFKFKYLKVLCCIFMILKIIGSTNTQKHASGHNQVCPGVGEKGI